jgi:hypothetical protein
MAISMPSSITGAAQTGLTTPTYTLIVDTSPDINAKQSVVSALGGTQTGVDVHSVARPFSVSVFRPKSFASLGKVNPVTGVLSGVGRNTYKCLTRKGVTPLAGQASQVSICRTEIEIPAGADTADAANVRAMLSAHIGLLQQISAGLGDTAINGVL